MNAKVWVVGAFLAAITVAGYGHVGSSSPPPPPAVVFTTPQQDYEAGWNNATADVQGGMGSDAAYKACTTDEATKSNVTDLGAYDLGCAQGAMSFPDSPPAGYVP